MHTTPLHPMFGVEVQGLDLSTVGEDEYPALRALFETHSALLFRDQNLDDEAHMRFAALWGPLEVRSHDKSAQPKLAAVSNKTEEGIAEEQSRHLMHLQANQLWHTDSTFLPVPALANILAARVVSSTGGETELVSTRAAFADLPDDLSAEIDGAVIRHRYAHSRAKIDAELAKDTLFTMWDDQLWRAIWPNPVSGAPALYLASHACGVEGRSPEDGIALIDRLMAHATRPEAIYTHSWRPGDVLMWDQRATMHRGRPWPYGEERTLVSICVSCTEEDGLDRVRPAA